MYQNAIVKTPCRNMVFGLTQAQLGQPDYGLALKQHLAYVSALEECGLKVQVLNSDEEFPDSVFVEDPCLITPACAILTNPGAASRRGETQRMEPTLRLLALPCESIKEPGTLDGGDVLMVGDTYFVGLSERTNQGGVQQLEEILQRYRMKVVTVPLTDMLHLKTAVAYLENNCLLAWTAMAGRAEFKRFDVIEVDPDEAYAANSIWINGTVLTPLGFPKTRNKIEKAGYRTVELDMSEFQKLDGGLSCLSLRF